MLFNFSSESKLHYLAMPNINQHRMDLLPAHACRLHLSDVAARKQSTGRFAYFAKHITYFFLPGGAAWKQFVFAILAQLGLTPQMDVVP